MDHMLREATERREWLTSDGYHRKEAHNRQNAVLSGLWRSDFHHKAQLADGICPWEKYSAAVRWTEDHCGCQCLVDAVSRKILVERQDVIDVHYGAGQRLWLFFAGHPGARSKEWVDRARHIHSTGEQVGPVLVVVGTAVIVHADDQESGATAAQMCSIPAIFAPPLMWEATTLVSRRYFHGEFHRLTNSSKHLAVYHDHVAVVLALRHVYAHYIPGRNVSWRPIEFFDLLTVLVQGHYVVVVLQGRSSDERQCSAVVHYEAVVGGDQETFSNAHHGSLRPSPRQLQADD